MDSLESSDIREATRIDLHLHRPSSTDTHSREPPRMVELRLLHPARTVPETDERREVGDTAVDVEELISRDVCLHTDDTRPTTLLAISFELHVVVAPRRADTEDPLNVAPDLAVVVRD